ncbi:putative phospholipase C [Gregarina niphandrodes]|uniref:Phospholipase C n=1 Tax=Gregarina niphandrodes TaxID=110365 RepID=A0A023BCV1_GRENI|nr:putative phospholipase C [Gregarina niphandrodes]EZG86543.1 putative phospholipase C [Gregarina niphandrodes]|eukprot:XP_011128753.1 putative phospholipase C [Gregarina niphandrodes]
MEICMSRWMESVITDDADPTEILYPGTHNSATREVSTIVVSAWAKCQEYTVEQQLHLGVRMLDLRVADDHGDGGEIWVTHWVHACPCLAVLESVCRFLNSFKSEIVVLRIERDSDRKLSNAGLQKLVHLLQAEFDDLVVPAHRLDQDNPKRYNVGRLRIKNRRLILVTRDSFYEELVKKYQRSKEVQWLLQHLTRAMASWSWTRGRKASIVHDRISKFLCDTHTLNKIREKAFLVLEAIITHEADAIAKHPFSSIQKANSCVHKEWMPKILDQVKLCPYVNAITCDFVNSDFCKAIVHINRQRMKEQHKEESQRLDEFHAWQQAGRPSKSIGTQV